MNANVLPVWASIARDMLPIMASSVSSERAFSSAGITISKLRNRLKGDVVEALQALKCAIHRDLLFRELPTSQSELKEVSESEPLASDESPAGSPADSQIGESGDSWYDIVSDVDDDDGGRSSSTFSYY
jgi:hypothetical protein